MVGLVEWPAGGLGTGPIQRGEATNGLPISSQREWQMFQSMTMGQAQLPVNIDGRSSRFRLPAAADVPVDGVGRDSSQR